MPLLTKIDADPLAAGRGVDDLGRPDRGQVAVALVGEDEGVRADPAHAGRDRRRAAVRRLDEVDRQVVVREDAAADRRDPDGRRAEVQLVEQLGDEAVDDAVTAAGAVVRRPVGSERVRPLETMTSPGRRSSASPCESSSP